MNGLMFLIKRIEQNNPDTLKPGEKLLDENFIKDFSKVEAVDSNKILNREVVRND